MPKTKTIGTEKSKKDSSVEKIIAPDEIEGVLEIDEKPEVGIPVVEEEDDELLEDDPLLDSEELDPFGDTWEQ